MNITLEKSTEQAEIIKVIEMHIQLLDADYLEEALQQMESSHSFKHSASVLSPNPHTILHELDLEAVKLKHFRELLALARSYREIQEKKNELGQAKAQSRKLSDIFGF